MKSLLYKICALTLLGICATGFLPNAADAQLAPSTTDLSVELSPASPGPFETVSARAVTHSFETLQGVFTWYQDGKLVATGKGKNAYSFRTKGIGSKTTLRVHAASPLGDQLDTTRIVYIGDVALIWSADTYTPPGYRGKALITQGADVTVAAQTYFIINGSRLAVKDIIYDWWLDDEKLFDSSGYGKNILVVGMHGSPNTPHTVRVRVSDTGGRITQEKNLELVAQTAPMLFYELDPLRGPVFQRAIIKEFDLASGNEAQILAVPLFTKKTLIPQFTATWKIDGKDIGGTTGARLLILRYTSQQGSAARQYITLDLENKSNPLQALSGSFLINVQ